MIDRFGVAPDRSATGVSLPSRTSRLSSWVWWATSSSTPNWEYSFFSVLKQCAQVETTFLTFVSLKTSAFCIASCWKTNSLPARRAGSPVQVSPSPSTANETPAMVEQLGDRAGGLLGAVLVGPGAADPEQPLDLVEVLDVNARPA